MYNFENKAKFSNKKGKFRNKTIFSKKKYTFKNKAIFSKVWTIVSKIKAIPKYLILRNLKYQKIPPDPTKIALARAFFEQMISNLFFIWTMRTYFLQL